MPLSSIPEWTAEGVLPPCDPGRPTSHERSPYRVGIDLFVESFCTNQQRTKILLGFLHYRKAMHNLGITKGLQWVNGSFLENIESLEDRHPEDIDVVTFFHLPAKLSQINLLSENKVLFNRETAKEEYCVDPFYVQINDIDPEYIITRASYWYSVWSHRRTGTWKGFIEIDLCPGSDDDALRILNESFAITENGS